MAELSDPAPRVAFAVRDAPRACPVRNAVSGASFRLELVATTSHAIMCLSCCDLDLAAVVDLCFRIDPASTSYGRYARRGGAARAPE